MNTSNCNLYSTSKILPSALAPTAKETTTPGVDKISKLASSSLTHSSTTTELTEKNPKKGYASQKSNSTDKLIHAANCDHETAVNASKRGSAHITLIACKNDHQKAVGYIFAEIIPLLKILDQCNDESPPKELRDFCDQFKRNIYKILRFSPLEIVDELVQTLAGKYPSLPFLNQTYVDFKTYFLRLSPFFSRYAEDIQLTGVNLFYTNKVWTLEDDLAYGKFCRSQVEILTKALNASAPLAKPLESPFKELPPSSKNTRRAAALLEKIGHLRQEKQKERHPTSKYEAFNTLRRSKNCYTNMNGFYEWGKNLVFGVYRFTNEQTKDMRVILSYKELVMTIITDDSWSHGQADVDKTWPFIEDIFEEILAMNLKRPNNPSAKEKEAFTLALKEFYSKAAELVWLIGNTQPLERGSGTVAEWMLGIVHLYHGMEPPTLKIDFPQLDVLDISFLLEDYKKIFTYFYEQSTLPEELRQPSIAGIPCDQVRELLTKITAK